MAAFALFGALAVGACGGVSLPESPTASCDTRGCGRALRFSVETLECTAGALLIRDLGEDRYRSTGCGRTVRLICEEECGILEGPDAISNEQEVAYRASQELLCLPSAVRVTEERETYLATCRDVSVRYRCDGRGCASLGSPDPALLTLRQLEPEVLDCLGRRRFELMIAFDAAGHVLEVRGEGLRTVRMRRSGTTRHITAEDDRRCLYELFDPQPAFPAYADSELRMLYGGAEARSPRALSKAAPPPHESVIARSDEGVEPPPTSAPAAAGEAGTPRPASASTSEGAVSDPPTEGSVSPSSAEESGGATTAASPETEGGAPAGPGGAAEAYVRGALDARREAILACVGEERTVLRASIGTDGSVRLSLRGAMEGAPEVGCVRSAVGDLTVPETSRGGEGELLHVLEAAP